MTIHVVQEGDTTVSIAAAYGITEERLVLENEIPPSTKLAVGEALVILYPEISYAVQEGDTLGGIADKYEISVMQLLQNNPYLSNREYIYPGETIVIQYKGEKISKLSTNGYIFPFVNLDILKKTLPYLTYLSIYSYTITADGVIHEIEDREIIRLAKAYGVAPIMMLTGMGESKTQEINVTHAVLSSPVLQDYFIDQLLLILRDKGYYGININIPYILPENRSQYVEFMIKFAGRISGEGFKVFSTFSLNTFEILTGIVYPGIEYARIGQAVDGIVFITYEVGNTLGVPSGIIAYDTIKHFLGYAVKEIPSDKMLMGIISTGYIWELPYEAGVSKGLSVNYNTAVNIATDCGADILYDDVTKSAYFQCITNKEYVIRFRDAQGIDALAKLVPEFGLNGIAIWNIMFYFPQMWLVINSQYEIEKIQ